MAIISTVKTKQINFLKFENFTYFNKYYYIGGAKNDTSIEYILDSYSTNENLKDLICIYEDPLMEQYYFVLPNSDIQTIKIHKFETTKLIALLKLYQYKYNIKTLIVISQSLQNDQTLLEKSTIDDVEYISLEKYKHIDSQRNILLHFNKEMYIILLTLFVGFMCNLYITSIYNDKYYLLNQEIKKLNISKQETLNNIQNLKQLLKKKVYFASDYEDVINYKSETNNETN